MDNQQTDGVFSTLACHACKKRKVKCDRLLPSCSLCTNLGSTCQFPSHPAKPGPKIGSTHKNKRRAPASRIAVATSSRADVADSFIRKQVTNSKAETHHVGITEEAGTISVNAGSLYPPPSQDSTAQHIEQEAASGGSTFSHIMYPSHYNQTRPPSPAAGRSSDESITAPTQLSIVSVCNGLAIQENLYHYLMESYFANMTSFTLFKPHKIEHKLHRMRTSIEGEALVAAMFSFSARFHSCYNTTGRPEYCNTPSYFADAATTKLEECLNEYGDAVPPFHLLQAYILLTFFRLTTSVRSTSWRLLGTCIRLAYEMNLHLVDANSKWSTNVGDQGMSLETWSAFEERRRAWWALWEMDVFSSTIRRLPLAINWTQNFTFLPVPDDCWFNDIYQSSCYLSTDPNLRWKDLIKAKNYSPRAWFIVINSLKRDAQSIIYNPPSLKNASVGENIMELKIISNGLYCATTSLPPALVYQGDALDFQTKTRPDDTNHHQYHSDIYAIHLITHLTHFMIHHREICAHAPWIVKSPSSACSTPVKQDLANRLPWKDYMKSAEQIVTIVRNSTTNHYKYVNPFLVNTLWFAASAQVAGRVFGPPSINKALAASNFELLALTIDRMIDFWHGMDGLKVRLARLEAKLKNLEKTALDSGDVDREHNVDGSATTRTLGMRVDVGKSQQYSAVDNSALSHAASSVGVMPDLAMLDTFEWFDTSAMYGQPMLLDDHVDQFLPYGVGDIWTMASGATNVNRY